MHNSFPLPSYSIPYLYNFVADIALLYLILAKYPFCLCNSLEHLRTLYILHSIPHTVHHLFLLDIERISNKLRVGNAYGVAAILILIQNHSCLVHIPRHLVYIRLVYSCYFWPIDSRPDFCTWFYYSAS
eukprot:NODE_283_length_11832_cov_0.293190.p6 type:complete len:129 gc:universal NODE_283_length_11832_cov_0.293190:2816-3202(+)